MNWFWRFIKWCFTPRMTLLESHASEYGRITLQQTELPEGIGWHCSIRAHRCSDYPGKPRYAWTGYGPTISGAMAAAIASADESPELLPIRASRGHAPKLGGAEFDE